MMTSFTSGFARRATCKKLPDVCAGAFFRRRWVIGRLVEAYMPTVGVPSRLIGISMAIVVTFRPSKPSSMPNAFAVSFVSSASVRIGGFRRKLRVSNVAPRSI